MGSMSDYDLMLQEVSQIVGDPVLSAEEQIERKVDAIIRELDEMCAMATHPETVDLIASQKIAFGQMLVRMQLILSFILASKPTTLRIVR